MMNSKDLAKKLKNPALQWVKGYVDHIEADITGVTLPEVELKAVTECLTIPEIPRWLADVIEESVSFERVIIKLGEIDSVSKASKVDYDLAAKAWVLGYTVEELLGVLLVDMPAPSYWKYYFLYSDSHGSYDILGSDDPKFFSTFKATIKVTEAVAKEKYPNFKLVSLEELENEG